MVLSLIRRMAAANNLQRLEGKKIMGPFREAIRDVSKAQTWTERLYFVSPVFEAALKAVWSKIGATERANAGANERMSKDVAAVNAKALDGLGISSNDVRILKGPFAGMAYISTSTGSVLGPKLIGSYEDEISPWIIEAINTDYDLVVDVGSAEGYYAVGFARSMPNANVIAYDIDAASRESVHRLAKLNGVEERVSVRSLCTPEQLDGLIAKAKRALVFVDIEGFETGLLDPVQAPALGQADIIVETHENMRPGTIHRLVQRFAWSHRIEATSAMPDEKKIELAISRGIAPDLARSSAPEQRRLPQLWMRLTRW